MQRQGIHRRLRDSLTGWVLSLVELGFDPKPGVGSRCMSRRLRTTWRVSRRCTSGHARVWSSSQTLLSIEPARFHRTIGLPLKSAGDVPVYVTCPESEKIGALENPSEDPRTRSMRAGTARITNSPPRQCGRDSGAPRQRPRSRDLESDTRDIRHEP